MVGLFLHKSWHLDLREDTRDLEIMEAFVLHLHFVEKIKNLLWNVNLEKNMSSEAKFLWNMQIGPRINPNKTDFYHSQWNWNEGQTCAPMLALFVKFYASLYQFMNNLYIFQYTLSINSSV